MDIEKPTINRGANNPRVFAETITIDAWRSAFNSARGEADLHIAVAFADAGRVGGGDAPVRFRLSLRRAEVHVLRDGEDIIEINRASVLRAPPPKAGKVRRKVEKNAKVGGKVKGTLAMAGPSLSASGSAEGSISITDTIEHIDFVGPMEVTPWKTDRGYAFKIVARPERGRLVGEPWTASVPVMKIRDTNAHRKRGEPPELRVEIHCLREDMILEDIQFTSDRFPAWPMLPRKKQIAVEQFIKDELARVGLPCGDLSDRFTRIVMGDAVPSVEP